MASSVGLAQVLREARERRGLTVEQLSLETTIPVSHVEALEAGRLEALPGAMYRRAEVRAYAEAVGLDPDVMLAVLKRGPGQVEPPLPPRKAAPVKRAEPPAPPASDVRRAGKALLVLAIGCCGLLWEQAGAPSLDLSLAPALPVPAVDPRALIDEAVRVAEPPLSTPSLRRALYDPGVAANGQRRARDGRLDGGVLVVHSTPRDARVTVNGVGWGTTPVAIRYLPLGSLRVRVGKTDYAMHERDVQLTSGQPSVLLRVTLAPLARRRSVAVEPAGRDMLVVTSVPAGARVTVNGIGWGTTPVSIAHLPGGTQRVRLVKEQFESEERVVDVREGRPGRVAITLKPVS